MRFFYFVIFLVFFGWHTPVLALSLIRDAEIEEAATKWVQSIFTVANLPPENAQVVLVNDPSINAFVAGGQTIFVHTGLFTNATSIDEVMFVLSHETGHIVGGHIVRGINALEQTQNATLISTILGGVLAVLSGRPDAGIAIMMGSQGSAMGQFLAYRQTEESSADRIAVDIMQGLGYSMQGFENIMKNLQRLERLNDESERSYLRTHPMTQNRVRDMGRFTKDATDVHQDKRFERIQAKLVAFMNKPHDVLSLYKGNSFAHRYARAIALYRQHELNKSFNIIDSLIRENPSDAYLYELKGQFSFETGRIEQAIKNYEKATQLKPNTPLIELALAQAYIELNKAESAQKALPILQKVTLTEPDLALGWRLLATTYARLGQDLQADYAMIEYERTNNNLSLAHKRAEKLKKKLDKNSPYYQRVLDILTLKNEDQ